MSVERIMSLDEEDDDESMNQAKDLKSMNAPITLNIGGMKYVTTKTTLAMIEDTFLYKMFIDGKFLADPLKDGSYLIDRDGRHFCYILNFLREGFVNIGDDSHVAELLQEAMFYQIPALIKHLQWILDKKQIESIESSILSKHHIQQICKHSNTKSWQLHHEFYANCSFWRTLKRIVDKNEDDQNAQMIVFKFKQHPSMLLGIFFDGSKSFIFQNGYEYRTDINFVGLQRFGCDDYKCETDDGCWRTVHKIKLQTEKDFKVHAMNDILYADMRALPGTPTNKFALELNGQVLLWCNGFSSRTADSFEIAEYEMFVCV